MIDSDEMDKRSDEQWKLTIEDIEKEYKKNAGKGFNFPKINFGIHGRRIQELCTTNEGNISGKTGTKKETD